MAAEQVLLLGAAGQLGHELNLCLKSAGYAVTALGRQQLDVSDLPAVRERVRQCQPRWIVNAAAYTSVDKAEQEVQLAQTVNAGLPTLLAEEAKRLGAALLHYSTDYVFNGRASRPYLETDATDPLSVYGRSKRDGELGIQASGARHLVLRTSWVVGAHGQNFLKTMLRLAAERDSLRVVADQTGVPAAADWLAGVSVQAMQLADRQQLNGLFHATPSGQTNWHAYAQYLFGKAALLGWTLKVALQDVQPISTPEYPLPAARPAYGLLDSQALAGSLGQTWPAWQDGVDRVLSQLRSPA
ncbi:MAG: dTDP-4-dehydrorhamnose reductase [Limnohabitans sp.]|nr:dTDP-4-dehydrorhamnose reductase [Limnohabitans sp.]